MDKIERQKLMMLSLSQRKTALALKTVFDGLQQIEEAESQQLKTIYQGYIPKFKAIQQRSMEIIRGTKINQSEMTNSSKYFLPTELQKVESILKQKIKIKGYWLRVFQNFFGAEEMSKMDVQLAAAIIDLDTLVNQDKLAITIQFGKNEWIQSGKVSKTFILNEGQLSRVEDAAVWLKKGKSIFSNLLGHNFNREECQEAFRVAGDLIHDVIPYSVQYYLTDTENLFASNEQSFVESKEGDKKKALSKRVKQ